MRKIFIVPNIITAFGLAAGLFVIFKVNMIEPGMGTYKTLLTSSFLLLFAGFADWVDGAIARVMHAESAFGFLFDSLSDAVTFGVAPVVLMLKSLSLEQGTPLSFLAVIGAMVFSICGILRLVRFNVTMAAIKKLPKHRAKKFRHFIGLPIPAAALAVVSLNLLFAYPKFEQWANLSETAQTLIMCGTTIVLGYFMVSRFKFPSAKFLHFRVPSFQLVFVAVIFAFFLMYGVLYFFPIALAAVVWLYILIGWGITVIRLIAGKKSKTLADFEPHHHDD
ncbi:MAG: CDP-alcohol phosphatidyltransferase family protein [Simkaniaceae bacterium]|nr:CDP-alcohol phosphatidyltransferase family protein [Candidatus Sacchlamyda saccharinae]